MPECRTMVSTASERGANGKRFRAIGGTLLLLLGGAVQSGCGESSHPFQPLSVHYDPDLVAVNGFLYWGPDVPIGDPPPARRTLPGSGAGAARATYHLTSTMVVGTEATPAFHIYSRGISGQYRVRIYLDDELWWETGRWAPSPSGSVDLYGKTWVPADTGVYAFRIVVDPDSQIVEVNESNNECQFEVHVIPSNVSAAILDVIQWRDGSPYEVDEVQVNTTVDIVVLSVADGSYPDVREVLSACGTVLLDHRISLSGGTLLAASRLDTLQFTPTSTGPCEIRFEVDPDGEFPRDRNPFDNVSVRTLTVQP